MARFRHYMKAAQRTARVPWTRWTACPLMLLALLALTVNTVDARSQSETDRIADVLHLQAGMRIADLGAGDGDWLEDLARAVGDDGHVFATEVEERKVKQLERSVESWQLGNISVLLGGQDRTGLERNCCEALMMRLVYHHFTDPAAMRASIKDAVRPGGLVAVIDIQPQRHWRDLEGVPDRGGHGIPIEELVDEMTGDGFVEVARHLDWNGDEDRFCVVFRR